MTRRSARWLWAATVTFALLSAVGTLSVPVGRAPDAPPLALQAPPAGPSGIVLDSLASAIVAANPFRYARRPSSTRFGTVRVDLPVRVRPSLQLSGISGPPWHAVLEGVPGHEHGILVRQGDRIADLVVESVLPSGVVVSGLDSVWVLSLRRVW